MKRPNLRETISRLLPANKYQREIARLEEVIRVRNKEAEHLESAFERLREVNAELTQALKKKTAEADELSLELQTIASKQQKHEEFLDTLSLQKRSEIMRAFGLAAKDDRMMQAIRALLEGLHDEVYSVANSPEAAERPGLATHANGGVYHLSELDRRIGECWAEAHKNAKKGSG